MRKGRAVGNGENQLWNGTLSLSAFLLAPLTMAMPPGRISEGHCIQLLMMFPKAFIAKRVHGVKNVDSPKLCNLAHLG